MQQLLAAGITRALLMTRCLAAFPWRHPNLEGTQHIRCLLWWSTHSREFRGCLPVWQGPHGSVISELFAVTFLYLILILFCFL